MYKMTYNGIMVQEERYLQSYRTCGVHLQIVYCSKKDDLLGAHHGFKLKD